MKVNGKVLLTCIYFIVTFIAAFSLQANPAFMKAIDDYIKYIQSLGVQGIMLYIVTSALLMTFAIPLQFIDMIVGIIYPIREAILVLIGSKLLGATMSYYIANHLFSEETRRGYIQSKYLKGLQELVRKEPFKYGLLIRFSSIPIIIRNYGLSVLPIRYLTYIACVFLQSSVSSPFQAYAGSQFTSFMDYAVSNSQNDLITTGVDIEYDEFGNQILSPEQLVANSQLNQAPHNPLQKSDSEKLFGLLIVALGLCCTVFIGIKIKRKVEEINRQAEKEEKEGVEQEVVQVENKKKK